jgi:hypothetical protein
MLIIKQQYLNLTTHKIHITVQILLRLAAISQFKTLWMLRERRSIVIYVGTGTGWAHKKN